MNKNKIGIISSLFLDNKSNKILVSSDYVNAIERVNGIPIIIPITSNLEYLDIYINLCNGFLFTGGIDINPYFYNENPKKNLGEFNTDFDLFQITLMQKVIVSKKPFLAICRGMQILNVSCGGTLYQDISEFPNKTLQHYQKIKKSDPFHLIKINTNSTLFNIFGKELYVNSFHHQCIKKLGTNLKISAIAPDNIIEAIELENYNFGVGVQWHPEMLFTSSEKVKPIFSTLIANCN